MVVHKTGNLHTILTPCICIPNIPCISEITSAGLGGLGVKSLQQLTNCPNLLKIMLSNLTASQVFKKPLRLELIVCYFFPAFICCRINRTRMHDLDDFDVRVMRKNSLRSLECVISDCDEHLDLEEWYYFNEWVITGCDQKLSLLWFQFRRCDVFSGLWQKCKWTVVVNEAIVKEYFWWSTNVSDKCPEARSAHLSSNTYRVFIMIFWYNKIFLYFTNLWSFDFETKNFLLWMLIFGFADVAGNFQPFSYICDITKRNLKKRTMQSNQIR